MKYLILVGIGGSNLGAKAVYEALRLADPLAQGKPVILFADTISPVMRERIVVELQHAKKEDITLNYVSKSGTTLESKENFEFFKEYAGKIVNTYQDFEFDKTIGGRFSVFTPVGTYPLEMAGVDVKAFLQGRDEAVQTDAEAIFKYMQQGCVIYNSFFFNPELEDLGKWFRQLMAESLGKDGKGILPIVSVGSTDLHSVAQMYFGGPKNILTEFIYASQGSREMDAIYGGTKTAYRNHDMPFLEYPLGEISARSLGRYMQTKMLTIIALAKLMGVNAFDQPDVEHYKAETRKLLTSE